MLSDVTRLLIATVMKPASSDADVNGAMQSFFNAATGADADDE